ncbi:MAG: response regulator transcription factor [Elusimicrobiales bacterium]|nr:response regulator transcription factor [Elusimicrobiales bacterium]
MRILIADDDDELRDLTEMVLSSAGYNVSSFPNGKLAWEALKKSGADMAVLDINMPEMDGLELLDLIRADERFKEMPVMLLTARKGMSERAQGLERGADDYLTKPYENDELIKRVKLLAQAYPANG